jgi:adenylate kinase
MHETIALLGPPGSGKGTQAGRLQEDLGYTQLSTGNLLREARLEGTELGRRAAEYMDRGDLVPDEVIVAMVEEMIPHFDGRAVLLDGFPRTAGQAEALDGALARHERELGVAVLIDVPDDVVVERISGRREGRSDDTPETVRERLRVYHDEIEPLAAYYEHRGLLRRVDGTGPPDDVYERVRSATER